MTLQNPNQKLEEEYKTFVVCGRKYLSVCFSCIVTSFVQKNYDHVPEKFICDEVPDWESTKDVYADILQGVQVAQDHKSQLQMWVADISLTHGSTNLQHILREISSTRDFCSFLGTLRNVSNASLIKQSHVRNFLKAQIRKKFLAIPHIDWRETELILSQLGFVLSSQEVSDILLEWLLTSK